MALPTNKRFPLVIDAFWDSPKTDPSFQWEKRRVEYKLALLAKESIILDILLIPKPEKVEFPLEPIYKETIIGSSAQSERKRNAQNSQQKMNWKNKSQIPVKMGIRRRDKPMATRQRKGSLPSSTQYWLGGA